MEHKYIKTTPIETKDKAIILGTIYPGKTVETNPTKNFLCDFYYGNQYSLWRKLKNIFTDLDILTFDQVKGKTFRKESAGKIIKMLKENHIAISDTILSADRNGTRSQDTFDENKTKYNTDLKDQIKNSDIKTIIFTSLDAKKRFFTHILKVKDSSLSNDIGIKTSISNDSGLGNDISYTILPSPSNRASRVSNTFLKEQKMNPDTCYTDWKKKVYEETFSPFIK